jgi:hypothetical protein
MDVAMSPALARRAGVNEELASLRTALKKWPIPAILGFPRLPNRII